jgi:hypothetical protein
MFLMLGMLLAGQVTAPDASKLIVTKPSVLVVVDVDTIRGEPWRLCWSPDGQQLSLVAMKRKDAGMDVTHHLIEVSGTVRSVDAEPPWASSYWEWKSWKSAPGKPEFVITIDQQKKNESATARPGGGAMARGALSGGDPGISIDEAAGQMSANVLIITLLLKGQVLGEWKGGPFVPGMTFGWAPPGMDAIAFADKDGHLVLMDEQGRRQRIDGTKDVRLPAWSADGARVAWVEKQDRKKFRIQVANVSGS